MLTTLYIYDNPPKQQYKKCNSPGLNKLHSLNKSFYKWLWAVSQLETFILKWKVYQDCSCTKILEQDKGSQTTTGVPQASNSITKRACSLGPVTSSVIPNALFQYPWFPPHVKIIGSSSVVHCSLQELVKLKFKKHCCYLLQ